MIVHGVPFSPERIVKPQMLGQPTDESRLAILVTEARERWMGAPRSVGGAPIPNVLDFLESKIPTGRDTLLDRFGIADIAVVAHMGWLEAAGMPLDGNRWPRVARYTEAVRRRGSFAKALAHRP